jgi:hypothetical protein
MLLGILGSGCGEGVAAGADPLSDPRIEQDVKAVQARKEDPRNLRRLIKHKVSSKDQEKSVPKASGRPRSTR